MARVFVCISLDGIGGAEKRFTGIWCGLKQDGRIPELKLVLHENLFNKLKTLEEFEGPLTKFREDIILFDFKFLEGYAQFRKRARIFRDEYTAVHDSIHFVGVSPLIAPKQRRILFSITANSLKQLNWKGKLTQIVSSFQSTKTDVLDPLIYAFLRSWIVFKRNAIFMTPGSFCNTDLFKPLPFGEKKNAVVFLGRLEEGKQIMEFVRAIPCIYDKVKSIVPDLEFHIFGSGTLQTEMNALLATPDYREIPIQTGFTLHTEKLLASSKVFLSLQRYNNYPSKSLLEGMSSGNIPLVTDCGTTDLMVAKEFGYFVPELFTEQQLGDMILELFKQPEEVLRQKSFLARKMVLDKYTFKASLDYFYRFYS